MVDTGWDVLAALRAVAGCGSLPGGGKRGGEIRYRVADIGRRRARRGEGEEGECAGKIGCEWCGVRGRCLPTFRLANLSVCWLVGLLGSRRLGELALHSGERSGYRVMTERRELGGGGYRQAAVVSWFTGGVRERESGRGWDVLAAIQAAVVFCCWWCGWRGERR